VAEDTASLRAPQGRRERRRAPEARRINFRILLGGLPVAVFYVLTRFTPAWVAIGGGFLASVVVFRMARTSGLIRLIVAFGLTILAVAAVVGILWDSEKAYLAAGPAGDILWPLLYAGSIAVRRPLVGAIAREMVPRLAGLIPVNDRLFIGLSVMWGSFDIVRGVVLIWLLRNLSVGEYIVFSRLFNWPINIILLVITIVLITEAGAGGEGAARAVAWLPPCRSCGCLPACSYGVGGRRGEPFHRPRSRGGEARSGREAVAWRRRLRSSDAGPARPWLRWCSCLVARWCRRQPDAS